MCEAPDHFLKVCGGEISPKEQVLDHFNHSKDNSPSKLTTELLIHPVEEKERASDLHS